MPSDAVGWVVSPAALAADAHLVGRRGGWSTASSRTFRRSDGLALPRRVAGLLLYASEIGGEDTTRTFQEFIGELFEAVECRCPKCNAPLGRNCTRDELALFYLSGAAWCSQCNAPVGTG